MKFEDEPDLVQRIIHNLEILAGVSAQRDAFIAECSQFCWRLRSADNLVIEFEIPGALTFLVDVSNNNFIAGGFIILGYLDWNQYEGNSPESLKAKAAFDAQYLETISVAEQLLGEPDTMINEASPYRQCAVWRRQDAFIFVLQGADDIEGVDIRLWLEYVDDGDLVLPDSQVFDWLCARHLSKIN